MRKLSILVWSLLLIACSVSPQAEAQTVYITRTGAKYHDSYCRYLRQSKIEIKLKDAIARGYDACSVCDPATEEDKEETEQPRSSTTSNSVQPNSKAPVTTKEVKRTTTSSSSQCTGTTKSGARCKRMTTSANGRCYQH